jgi:catechol 2,3-dioxygenase-like lactoylglutathione lyase family enzyme
VDILINVDVDDLEAAIAFYQRGIGLRVGRRLFEGTVVEMLGTSSPIYLMEKKAGTLASGYTPQFRDYGRHWTPVHLDFIVPNQRWASRVMKTEAAKGS